MAANVPDRFSELTEQEKQWIAAGKAAEEAATKGQAEMDRILSKKTALTKEEIEYLRAGLREYNASST
jgi:hypothetical protein